MPEAKYEHAEAYNLMNYRAADGETEVIWNSRDGVTPFAITLRSGKEARHVDWRSDRRAPDFQPPAGSRMFVDLTPERARVLAARGVDRYLADPEHRDAVLEQFGVRERAIEELAASYMEREGEPDLVEVTEDTVRAREREFS